MPKFEGSENETCLLSNFLVENESFSIIGVDYLHLKLNSIPFGFHKRSNRTSEIIIFQCFKKLRNINSYFIINIKKVMDIYEYLNCKKV